MTAMENQEKAKEQEKEQELGQDLEQECETRSERQHEQEHVTSEANSATHEDNFCERRRQQNREAQRRFRNKRAKEREAEALQARPVLTTTITSTSVSGSIASVTPILAPTHSHNDSFPFSFVAPAHTTAVPKRSDTSIAASPLPLSTPLPSLYSQNLLGQDPVTRLDNTTPYMDTNLGDIEDLVSSRRNSGDFSVPLMHDNFDQSSLPDTYADIDGTYTWTDEIGLDLLFSDPPCPHLSSGQSLEWSEQLFSIGPPVVEGATPPMSGSSTAPSRDYAESLEEPSDIPVLVNHDKQLSSLDKNHLDMTPPDSRQGHSSTKLVAPISPPQRPKIPSEATNGTKIEPNQPLLHMAIDSGHEGIIRIILDQGVDINEKNSDGSTALHMAVQRRQENVLPLLLEKGADVNAMDGDSRTPIHMAIYSDFQTGLKLLLGQKP